MAIDVSNLQKKTKHEKLRKVFFRVLMLFVAAAAVFVVIYTKDAWYPEMEGILGRVPELPGFVRLAEGNFPVTLSSADAETVRVQVTGNGIAFITDTKTAAFNAAGSELVSDLHNYGNPAIYAGGNSGNNNTAETFAAYDIGGMNFSFYRKGKLRYSKTLDEQILLARTGTDRCAVVTKGSKHPAVLSVFDVNGQNIFNYKSITRITDVTFDRNSTGCYITLLDSAGGDLVSQVVYYNFTETGKDQNGTAIPQYKSDVFKTLALSLTPLSASAETETETPPMLLVGDRVLAVLSPELKTVKEQPLTGNLGNLKSYSVREKAAVFLFESETRGGSELLFMDSFYSFKQVQIPADVTDVAAVSDTDGVLLLTDTDITGYSSSGVKISDIKLNDSFEHIFTDGKYIYLQGFNEINRIDLL
jgi:hypothetical protein